MSEAAFRVEDLRREYPALARPVEGRRLVYLDNACTALKPRAVAEAARRFYEELGACGGKRSTHLLAQRVEAQLREAREEAKRFLGAESANEIVFTSGTTEAANLLARAFPYEDGRREVVLTDLEHNGVFLPFFEAERRGEISLKYVRSKGARLDPDDFKRAVTGRTALVAVTHASNVAGGVQPVAEICRIARARGAAVFCDDAQFVSSHREDVQTLGVDFAAFSAHKIGGPFGLGVLYGREQRLNTLRHYKLGGGAVRSVTWKGERPEVEYVDAPLRFEGGVANFAAFGGLVEALRLLSRQPERALRAHVAGLVRRCVAGLARLEHVRVVGSPEDLERGSIVSFYATHPEFSIHDFNLYLNHELPGAFVAVRAGEHCAHLLHQSLGLDATVRASFFAYNTPDEVDLLVEATAAYCREACAA